MSERVTFHSVALAALCLPLLLVGCATTDAGVKEPSRCDATYRAPDAAALLRALGAAEARWSAAGLHSYQYDLTVSAFLAPDISSDVRYVIRDDQTVSVTANDSRDASRYSRNGTMEGRFAAIHATLQGTFRADVCQYFRVQHDPADGHVTQVESGYGERYVSDTQVTERITHFARL